MKKKVKNKEKSIGKSNFLDYSILVPYLIMAVFGLIMVFSVTVPAQLAVGANIYRQVISQAVFFLLSLGMMTIIFRMNIRTFQSNILLGTFVIIEGVLLVISRFAFHAVNGAHGWIPLPGGFGTIQPSEFLKVFIIWYLALIFSHHQETHYENGQLRRKGVDRFDIRALFTRDKWYQNLFSGWRLWMLLLILVVAIMPDIGDALICLFIAFVMLAVSGISYKWATGYFRMGFILVLVFSAIVFVTGGNLIPSQNRFSYLNNRFRAWINPFSGLATYGHQLANSYYAIANGGWLGRGLGNSIEKKGYLPEASTDFIFSVTIEELGVIGGILILGVLFFLILRIMLVGIRARDPFNAFICIGVGSMLLIQTFVNVGGATGIIPETGVTFPFLSQGGSSLFVLSIAVALALNSASHEKLLALDAENKRLLRAREEVRHWDTKIEL